MTAQGNVDPNTREPEHATTLIDPYPWTLGGSHGSEYTWAIATTWSTPVDEFLELAAQTIESGFVPRDDPLIQEIAARLHWMAGLNPRTTSRLPTARTTTGSVTA